MPWTTFGRRKKTELNPQVADLWTTLRQMQSTLGGLGSTVANVALAVQRTDTRNEHAKTELDQALGRLEAATSTLARLGQLVEEKLT